MTKRWRFLPHPDEHLLLQAATQEPPAAFNALKEFLSTYGDRGLTATSTAAVPSLLENLHSYPPAAEVLAPFRDSQRHIWLRNQRNFHAAASAIALLEGSGVNTMLLKGGAIVAGEFRTASSRPMGDIDFLVPLSQAERARDALLNAGWKDLLNAGGNFQHVLRVMHGAAFALPSGIMVDLHWHAIIDCLDDHDDDAFWEAAVPAVLSGVPTGIPHPSDLLLQVIAHGVRFNEPRIIAWVLDAHAIITSQADDFDWGRLLQQGRRTGQILQLQTSLEYLRSELGTPVPNSFIDALKAEKVPALDRLSFDAQNREDSTINLMRRDVSAYLRRTRDWPLGTRLRGAAWQIQASRGIENPIAIPFYMLKRLHRRLHGQPP